MDRFIKCVHCCPLKVVDSNVFAMNKKRLLVLKISLVISLLLVLLVIADSIINKRGVHAMTLLLIPFGIAGYLQLKKKSEGE